MKDFDNNNSHKIVNKNNTNLSNKAANEQILQQIIDEQALEKQKQTMELMHVNKNVEALGCLVQYLVFTVSTIFPKY